LAGLLFVASPAVARVWGDTTIGNFVNLSYVEQAMFLAGALNTVGNIGGIRCSLPVNTRQVHELIMKQVELGQLDQRDNFTVAMARTLFKVGCTTKEPSCPGLCGHILTGDKKAA
jgi:hypothetical protein